MSSPEDIPEDRELSFPCDDCGGDITLHNGFWSCNGCDFKEKDDPLGIVSKVVSEDMKREGRNK